MANLHRGEIDAELDGRRWTLCLTLGALAELEAAYDGEDFLSLAQRFSNGKLKPSDAIRILGAGLRGAGHEVSDAEVSRMRSADGAAGHVRIVARLLSATFASGDQEAKAGN